MRTRQLLTLAVTCALLIPAAAVAQAPGAPNATDLIRWMSGTVMCIKVLGKTSDGTTLKHQPQGAGFLVSRLGYVMTNSHVIRPQTIKDSPYSQFVPSSLVATFHSECDISREPTYELEVITWDEHADLALLKIKQDSNSSTRDKWRYIPLGDSDLVRPGDKLITIGFPGGQNLADTDNAVKALDRTRGRIQFKASLEPGYSGGPVLDDRGYVVGVVWGGALDKDTANYFIPINFTNHLLQFTRAPKQ